MNGYVICMGWQGTKRRWRMERMLAGIDKMVYAVYGLTEDEIKVVEETA
jgi:hypothetical protein